MRLSGISATTAPLLRTVVQVDRAQISYPTALRNTLGVVVPLLVGATTGQLLAGLTVSLGALQAAFSDGPEPYRQRVSRMLLAGLWSAASVFVGSTTGEIGGLAVLFAAVWGFGAGLIVALGQTATQIGLSSLVLLLVFGARPAAPLQAAAEAGLILAGAVLQAMLAVAAWPVRPLGPQRTALAAAFHQLAASTTTTADPRAAPLATADFTGARLALSGLGNVSSAAGETLRTLLDEAERIRLEMLALEDARHRLHGTAAGGCQGQVQHLETALDGARDALDALADTLRSGQPIAHATPGLERVERAARGLHTYSAAERNAEITAVQAHVEALAGQLRAALEAATQDSPTGEEEAARAEATRPLALRLREPWAILRANLTLHSAAGRHAVRLACCVAVADALTRSVAVPRAYWVPMTVAIVLKPDFTGTFSRGLGRVAGTALGLVVATALVYTLFGSIAGRIVFLGVLMFLMRSIGRANYGLFVTALTGLVVILTSFAGTRPEAAIVERGIDTAIGGALALAAYAVWPTWERTQTPGIVADLLEAYHLYFAAVMAGYLQPGKHDPAQLNTTRLAARVARTNAEASLDRLRDEPARSSEDLDRIDSLLANSHRFVHSVMALEAGLYQGPVALGLDALPAFVADVDTTLGALAQALRDPSYRLGGLPSLRADQRALAESVERDGMHLDKSRQAIVVAESDRITDSINTMTAVLQRATAKT